MKKEYLLLFSLAKALTEIDLMKDLLFSLAAESKPDEVENPDEFAQFLKKNFEADVSARSLQRFEMLMKAYDITPELSPFADSFDKSPELSDLSEEELLKLLSGQKPPEL